MIGQTLNTLIKERLTTARELGEVAGVSPSTVYRWINGESQPSFHSVRLMVRHLPSRRAQEHLLAALSLGTPWTHAHPATEYSPLPRTGS